MIAWMTVLSLFAVGAMCIVLSDDSDGAYTDVEGNSTYVETGGTVTFTLSGDAAYYYTASLLNSSGTAQSGAVSSSGTLGSTTFTSTTTVTAPTTAGNYTLSIVFYEDSTKAVQISTKAVPLKVVDPVKLTATLSNNGEIAMTISVFFVINGERVTDSEKTVTVAANGTEDVTYDYVVKDLSDSTSFYLASDDSTIAGKISGLGPDNTQSFYTSANDYTLIISVVSIVLVLLVIITVYIYRKPVKNFGKPKARR
ncbi:MAG: hypothetical protein WCR83_00885 [Candidatus Methanomethylophilaceae archaeon]